LDDVNYEFVPPSLNIDADILGEYFGSDHLPILLDLKL